MSEAAARPKILVVDDEAMILESMTRLLKNEFTVLLASSAEDGRSIIEKNPDIAVVLTDQNMPGLKGLELLELARTLAPDATRVLLSAHVELEQMMTAVNSRRVHRFVLKPWENDYLRLQLSEALASHIDAKEKRRLEALSITDAVTGLKNHQALQDQLKIEIDRAARHSRTFSFFMIDIDHFKSFNEEHGHQGGDALLKKVSERLTSLFRSIDFVARYGGDEFAVILPDTPFETALKVGERIRAAFSETVRNDPTFVSLSIGISSYPQHGEKTETLIELADRALYKAKRQGRNQSVGA